jgi:hypothetical protein
MQQNILRSFSNKAADAKNKLAWAAKNWKTRKTKYAMIEKKKSLFWWNESNSYDYWIWSYSIKD